uniref:Helicase ATP-binding domain-containing protein n=1 Tax=viral metagenome TaxID=1070528 RepID=A0A6C0E3N9_9ZZZZ
MNMPQTLTTTLGSKGYTLLKSELTNEQQDWIRKELTVKPYTHGAPTVNLTTFPAYRESGNKLYVPRFFGEQHFGTVKQMKIPEGDDIDVTFQGALRDYQVPVVEKYLSYVTTFGKYGGLLDLVCAWGKTSSSLYILSQLKKKTIVIVHKEFLMNQWIERIQQFLPTARIGKIQGQTIDIENKDIVLAMLQSLSMKEYPSSLFDSFGFTIIDEVHHISSETFSRALYKFVTKYSLGLSATMNRKDGTTKIFKMFLGEVVHKTESKGEREVEVRCINYKTNDEEFNETILDYRGQPQNSSMITKICSYNRRTEFIIQTLTDFICTDVHEYVRFKKEMDQQIPACKLCLKSDNYLVKNTCCNTVQYCLLCMNHVFANVESKKRPKCPHCAKVLVFEQNYIENPYVKPVEQTHTIVMAHNLNVLEYIYTKFVCKNLASVGYYVGGMKEQELKASEKKQVILASYSMCSEGLDIPTLTTEFLISPKTDVVQIVGRILRAKHATAHPIIYDFVDSHDVFQRQWLKRKAYYKKQNYRIIGTNSNVYTIDTKKWTKISEGTCIDDELDEEENDDKKGVIGKCLLSTFKKGSAKQSLL